jgi:hypothetical protein
MSMGVPAFDDVYHEAESYEIDVRRLVEDIAFEQREEDVILANQQIDPLKTTRQSIYIDIHTVLARLHGNRLTLPRAVESRMHHLIAEQLNVLDDPDQRRDVYVDVCRNVARVAIRAALDASGAFGYRDDSFETDAVMNVLVERYAERLLEKHDLV